MYRVIAVIIVLWLLWQLGISLSDILAGITAVVDFLRQFARDNPDTLNSSSKH